MNFSIKISALIFCTLLTINIFGQETTNQYDSIKKNYVSSLDGIELKTGGYKDGYMSGRTISPFLFTYLKEKSLFKTTSLIFRAGLIVSPRYLDNVLYGVIIYDPVIKGKKYYLNFSLNFEVEPRWYWGIKGRSINGKAVLNSGWFLSLPISTSVPLEFSYNTIPEGYDASFMVDYRWIKDKYSIFYNIGPSVGYRYSLSKNFFIEGMTQIIADSYYLKSFVYKRNSSILIEPRIKISGAYIFKDYKKKVETMNKD